ncbi:MAG: HEAT repeat domain-containing protein [Candidatus Micrarchaeota archaeon]
MMQRIFRRDTAAGGAGHVDRTAEMGKAKTESALKVAWTARDAPTKLFNFRQEERPSDQRSTAENLYDRVFKNYATVVGNTLKLLKRNLVLHASGWAERKHKGPEAEVVARIIIDEKQVGYTAAIERLTESPDSATISDMMLNGSFEEKRVGICVAATVLDSKHIDTLLIVVKRESGEKDATLLREAIRSLGNYKRLGDTNKCEFISERLKETLEHRDSGVRATALNSMRKILDSKNIRIVEDAVIGRLKDDDPGVRLKAAVALSVSNSENAGNALASNILTEKDADVAAGMFLSLEAVCTRRGEGCEEALKDINELIRDVEFEKGDAERFRKIRIASLDRQLNRDKLEERVVVGGEHEGRRVGPIEADLIELQVDKFRLRKDDLRTGVDVGQVLSDEYIRKMGDRAAGGHHI